MENSFTIGDKSFKVGKIDALTQFHIVRRIGPLLSELLPALAQVGKKNMDGLSEEEKLSDFAKIATPFMIGFSKLSDTDADYVLFRLLAAVEVEQPQFRSWAKVSSHAGIMMQDLELPILMQAAARSFMFSLKGFFSLLPQKALGK